MKKITKHIYILLLVILSLIGCNEDPEYFTLETPVDQMNIEASVDDLILLKEDKTKDAITFSWSEAADRGVDLVYYFRLYHSEMTDLQSELIQVGTDSYSITFTVNELNDLLASWNILPGDEATIEAEVLAVSEDSPKYMKPEISITQFSVVGYDIANTLYLTVVSKFGVERTTKLNEITTGSDIYYLSEEYEEGTKFRFSRNFDVTWPAYVMGVDNTTLELEDEGAQMFTVPKTGKYVMTVNVADLSLKFLDVYNSPTGVIAVVGDAVSDIGWDAGKAVQQSVLVQEDVINHPEIISYTGNFAFNSPGDQNAFKFVGNAYWGDGLYAEIANSNPLDENQLSVTTDGAGDKKWVLTEDFESGLYTLELNLNTMKIALKKQ